MRIRRGTLLLVALALAACDFPTEPPRWEQMWVVPGETVEISVAELLPSGITLAPDETAFRVTTSPTQLSISLGEMCEACQAFDGTTAPKPEFSEVLGTTSPLPPDLVSAVLAGGELDVSVAHSFSFDPLRPSSDPAQRGYVVIAVTSNGATVARDSISGHDQPFPAGTTLAAWLPIGPATVTNTLDLEIRVYSPAGDPTEIRTADTLGITMAESIVDVSEVTVRMTQVELSPTSSSMSFEIDDDVLDRIQSGALRMEIQNPFAIVGSLTLRFDVGHRVIEKSLAVEPGTFSRRVEFEGRDLRDILGAENVDLVTSGTIEAPAGTLTVTPTQTLILDTSFELVIVVGDLEEDA